MPGGSMSPALEFGKTLSEQIVEALADKIIDGILAPGQPLSEAELASYFGTSRTPVREALRILEGNGLVKSNPRQHSTVSPLTPEDCIDLFSTRALLEGHAVKSAAAVVDHARIDRLEGLLAGMRAAAVAGDTPDYQESNRRFHLYLYDGCPSRTVRQLIAQLWRKTLRYSSLLYSEHGRFAVSLYRKGEILHALKERNGARAEAELRALLESGLAVIVKKLSVEGAR